MVGVAILLTVQSAINAKRSGIAMPLVMLEGAAKRTVDAKGLDPRSALETDADLAPDQTPDAAGAAELVTSIAPDTDVVRYFDGRPVRPVRIMWMRVTAYSPDEQSCGIWADGRTATNHSVWTNAMELVAADTTVLPFGSLISVPGYAQDRIVPVLDRGGAIKGSRLDVLYPTHERALEWGVRDLPVVVWEYADDSESDAE